MSAAGTAAGLGCSIVVSIMLCVGGGLALDSWLNRSPLFTLAGVGLGLAAAGYQLYELTTIGRKDRAPGPLSRGIARVPLRKGREE
jgi:ATP synthase protein I